MSEHETEKILRRAFEALPRERASPGFGARVLARLERPARRSPAPARWVAAAAALAGLLVATAVGLERARRADDRAATRARELRREHRRLSDELAALREVAAAPPMIYLGGNDELDLVLDLSPWVEPAADRGARPGGRLAADVDRR